MPKSKLRKKVAKRAPITRKLSLKLLMAR